MSPRPEDLPGGPPAPPPSRRNDGTSLREMLAVQRGFLPGSPTPLTGMRDVTLILLLGCVVGAVVARAISPTLPPLLAAAVVFAALVLIANPLLWIRIAKPIVAAVRNERRRVMAHEATTTATAREQEFDARLGRALDMADNEEDVLEVVRRALVQQMPAARGEFLLADASHSHMQRVSVSDHDEPPGCSVDAPQNCPAVRRGQTTYFSRDDSIDACPRLADRPYGACSATCVPVTVMGRAAGVLHVVDVPDANPGADQLHTMEALARLVGARIGLLRAMKRTSLQAATDPLTGLANRRSLEEVVRTLYERGEDFAFAIADLDHFKLLNDAHGHEVGDRALRLFARTMRDVVRPIDEVARYGGEEFVIVLRGAAVNEAVEALERTRLRLAERLAAGTTPDFTASYGLAHSTSADRFEELFALADQALLQAKRAGRDRIVVAGANPSAETIQLQRLIADLDR